MAWQITRTTTCHSCLLPTCQNAQANSYHQSSVRVGQIDLDYYNYLRCIGLDTTTAKHHLADEEVFKEEVDTAIAVLTHHSERYVESRVVAAYKALDKGGIDKPALASHFMHDLRLDDLDHVEVVWTVGDEFNLEIPDKHAKWWATLGDIVKYMMDNTARKTSQKLPYNSEGVAALKAMDREQGSHFKCLISGVLFLCFVNFHFTTSFTFNTVCCY